MCSQHGAKLEHSACKARPTFHVQVRQFAIRGPPMRIHNYLQAGVLLIVLVVGACSTAPATLPTTVGASSQIPAATTSAIPKPTATPTAVQTTVPTEQPPEQTPTPPAGEAAANNPSPTPDLRYKAVEDSITSPALEGNLLGDSATRPLHVLLPPGYADGTLRYPVLYLLAWGDGRPAENALGFRYIAQIHAEER